MPSISKCPQCEQSVSIPPGVPGEITVRCPLCNAEYPLADALALLPPMLVPLGLQVLGLTADGSAGLREAGVGAVVEPDSQTAQEVAGVSALTDFALATGQHQATGQPQAMGEQQVWGNLLADAVETEVVAIDPIVLDQQAVAVGQPSTEAETAAAAGIDGSALAMAPTTLAASESSEQAAAELGQTEGQPTEQLGQATAESQSDQPAKSAEEAFALIDTGGTGEAALPFAIKARPSRSREVNPLVHIGGMIVFGVVGLGLGYYFSNLLFGPRMDFLRIPLPFVRHTYKHWGGGHGEPSDAKTVNNGAVSEDGASAGAGRNRSKPQQPQGQEPQGGELPAEQKPAPTTQEPAAPPPGKEVGDSAPKKLPATEPLTKGPPATNGSSPDSPMKEPPAKEPSAQAQQPQQPAKKPGQQPGDEPKQLPGDLPDIRSSEPIEEPELDVPPKSSATPPTK